MSRAKPIELKWPVWILLALMVTPALLMAYNAVNEMLLNRQYIALGKSVDCIERPAYQYFAFCNATFDGEACMHETRTRMQAWYADIDYACSKGEPQRTFVFPGPAQPEPPELEYAEQG